MYNNSKAKQTTTKNPRHWEEMELEKMNAEEVKEVSKKKRTHRPGSITPLGKVCYTVAGAFYVQYQGDMHIRKGVYRLERGGFLDAYNEYILDRHQGFGDIYDENFISRFLGDIIVPQAVDTYQIHSYNAVERILQRCIN